MSDKDKMSDLMLEELTMNKSGLDLSVSGGPCLAVAEAFAEQFTESNAVNFLEMSFHNEGIGKLTVTIQKVSGETPGDQLRNYKKEIAALKSELAEAKANKDLIEAFNISTEMLKAELDDLRKSNAALINSLDDIRIATADRHNLQWADNLHKFCEVQIKNYNLTANSGDKNA